MLYDVKTPEEYLRQLPDDWRKEGVNALREIIKAKGPKLTERINYKMLGYGDGDNIVFCLNAQKNYVSLYVGNASKVDPDGKLLEGLNRGKGCIRFTKSIDISNTRIDEFVERAVEMWEQGEDFDC
jgi:uncharacterized protein YdhG (YjbR/CyaY superfamily)